MERRIPSGFIATCQCGAIVGAMDFERTERADASKMLGGWLYSGYTVTPKFSHSWRCTVESCRCADLLRQPTYPLSVWLAHQSTAEIEGSRDEH